MLFDLRGRGGRRTVKAFNLTFAILMGGGSVLFDIGGAVMYGFVYAFCDNAVQAKGHVEDPCRGSERGT